MFTIEPWDPVRNPLVHLILVPLVALFVVAVVSPGSRAAPSTGSAVSTPSPGATDAAYSRRRHVADSVRRNTRRFGQRRVNAHRRHKPLS